MKVLKIARAVGECNLRTFKTSRVTINHEMHVQVHTLFYLFYSVGKLLKRATLCALRTTLNASMVSTMLTCFI